MTAEECVEQIDHAMLEFSQCGDAAILVDRIADAITDYRRAAQVTDA